MVVVGFGMILGDRT